jgi:hypothetical protein
MGEKAQNEKRTPTPDALLKTSKKKDIELTEKELGDVSGGLSLNFTKIQFTNSPIDFAGAGKPPSK